ncbi:hypothetical protein [Candidatus Formimonas warabiya]|uniref:Uncharacterized protein n=1 Tax=Formimonas warabiya TaxID=1761012 RepID=A0A3G1KM61_FORW1|nr:hypothetical protein [Candidatus Formimonas warabiya]ATW23541.1 hypothetical protein DCMF_00900 [Candidatus Formimonas warabiya]
MDQAASKLTVSFEEPLWVGVYERERKKNDNFYCGRKNVKKSTEGDSSLCFSNALDLTDNKKRLCLSINKNIAS